MKFTSHLFVLFISWCSADPLPWTPSRLRFSQNATLTVTFCLTKHTPTAPKVFLENYTDSAISDILAFKCMCVCVCSSSICLLWIINGESVAAMDVFLMMRVAVNMQNVYSNATTWLHHWFLSKVASNMNKYSQISMWGRKGVQRCVQWSVALWEDFWMFVRTLTSFTLHHQTFFQKTWDSWGIATTQKKLKKEQKLLKKQQKRPKKRQNCLKKPKVKNSS